MTKMPSSTSRSSSRSNSIEITDNTTINQLRGLDIDGGGGGGGGRGGRGHNGRTSDRAIIMQDMGRSLNFLNLDNKQQRKSFALQHPSNKTAGGANPRLRMMQLRLNRLKRTSPQERLYQSDSALFSSANADGKDPAHSKHQLQQEVWFKSLYPKQGALEKLDEAEAEYEESSQHRSDSEIQIEDDALNTSGTDMWLFEANHSAPGFLPGEAEIGGSVRRRKGRKPSIKSRGDTGIESMDIENEESEVSHIRRQQQEEKDDDDDEEKENS